MSGFHCGGDPIYQWNDGSSSNYGTIKDISGCRQECSKREECGGFIIFGTICAFWTRTPLNPYRSRSYLPSTLLRSSPASPLTVWNIYKYTH